MNVERGQRYVFLFSLLCFIGALLFQLKLRYFLGFYPDLVLVALVISAFFVDFLQILVLVLTGILVLNWQPTVSAEMVVFGMIPLLVFWISRFLPGRLWFNSLLFSVLSVIVFYLVTNFQPARQEPVFLVEDILACLVFGSLIFYTLDRALRIE